tara:strand:- start:834 stop:1046 length:213 start_codon:yes stop_codon:yes gene_type:complete
MYNCQVYHDYDIKIVLLDVTVPTLKELAKELNMTYQQIADLNSRKGLRKYQQFKYFPKIDIKEIKKCNVI